MTASGWGSDGHDRGEGQGWGRSASPPSGQGMRRGAPAAKLGGHRSSGSLERPMRGDRKWLVVTSVIAVCVLSVGGLALLWKNGSLGSGNDGDVGFYADGSDAEDCKVYNSTNMVTVPPADEDGRYELDSPATYNGAGRGGWYSKKLDLYLYSDFETREIYGRPGEFASGRGQYGEAKRADGEGDVYGSKDSLRMFTWEMNDDKFEFTLVNNETYVGDNEFGDFPLNIGETFTGELNYCGTQMRVQLADDPEVALCARFALEECE